MGVYIKGIEKPKHCTECYFVCRDQCVLQDNSYDYDTFKEQKKHCPLQPIDDEKVEKTQRELIKAWTVFKSVIKDEKP